MAKKPITQNGPSGVPGAQRTTTISCVLLPVPKDSGSASMFPVVAPDEAMVTYQGIPLVTDTKDARAVSKFRELTPCFPDVQGRFDGATPISLEDRFHFVGITANTTPAGTRTPHGHVAAVIDGHVAVIVTGSKPIKRFDKVCVVPPAIPAAMAGFGFVNNPRDYHYLPLLRAPFLVMGANPARPYAQVVPWDRANEPVSALTISRAMHGEVARRAPTEFTDALVDDATHTLLLAAAELARNPAFLDGLRAIAQQYSLDDPDETEIAISFARSRPEFTQFMQRKYTLPMNALKTRAKEMTRARKLVAGLKKAIKIERKFIIGEATGDGDSGGFVGVLLNKIM